MRIMLVGIVGVAGLTFAAAGADAATKSGDKAERAELLQKLIDCRSIAEADARLSCFERQTALLENAEASREVVIIDRKQSKKDLKENFGLPVKPLVVGKADDSKDNGVTDITSTLRSARLLPSNHWLFVLEDGARWYQTEQKSLREPKPGQSIRIRKSPLGGFLANINNQSATRVRRVDGR